VYSKKRFKSGAQTLRCSALLALSLFVSACASHRELLNSDRIEARYGSYGVEVLTATVKTRRSSLYSLENGEAVTRTYAIVQFMLAEDEPDYAEIASAQAQIVAGASIGKTFRDAGWDIRKETIYTGSLKLPAGNDQLHRLMHLSGAQALALHVYRFILKKDPYYIDYATIIEIHHPDFVDAATLGRWYPASTTRVLDDAQVTALKSAILADI
jgi:hypothetical protein